jgi:hypothetical protein
MPCCQCAAKGNEWASASESFGSLRPSHSDHLYHYFRRRERPGARARVGSVKRLEQPIRRKSSAQRDLPYLETQGQRRADELSPSWVITFFRMWCSTHAQRCGRGEAVAPVPAWESLFGKPILRRKPPIPLRIVVIMPTQIWQLSGGLFGGRRH